MDLSAVFYMAASTTGIFHWDYLSFEIRLSRIDALDVLCLVYTHVYLLMDIPIR
ncbi:Uncharacterised protein [Chlamydia trachomatis]|nr:Uncharacterised protein [Chlamydia trachomatis]